jgi:hypothetical protein
MRKSTEMILRPDEADTEVELSAQDLLALSDSRLPDPPATSKATRPPIL